MRSKPFPSEISRDLDDMSGHVSERSSDVTHSTPYLARFLEAPPQGLPVPFPSEGTGFPMYSTPCGGPVEGPLMELRSLMAPGPKRKKNRS